MNVNEDEKSRFDQTSTQKISAEQARSNQTLRARAAFDASVGHIDADTRRRLRDARVDALQPVSKRQRPGWALPLGAAFATALALVVFWPHASIKLPATADATHGPLIAAVSANVIADPTHDSALSEDASLDNALLADNLIGDSNDAADPELLGNLDFYGWLAQQPALIRSGG